jgi:hypothetical protein
MSKKNQNSPSKDAADRVPAGTQSRLADYFWANMIFFGFLSLLAMAVWQGSTEPSDDPSVTLLLGETFRFMLMLFGGGFLLVTLFDAAYDFFAEKAETMEPGQ